MTKLVICGPIPARKCSCVTSRVWRISGSAKFNLGKRVQDCSRSPSRSCGRAVLSGGRNMETLHGKDQYSYSASLSRESSLFGVRSSLQLTSDSDRTCWELSNEECDIWDDLLRYSIAKGFDTGIEAVNVLERVAEIVSQN